MTKKLKILNLYAGIGGNRKLWGDAHDITAVEYNEEIAAVYQDFYPKDKIIVGDAHEYLLKHYKDFDFIWSSPPCQSHSTIINSQYTRDSYVPKYPDMKLWQEIIFLKRHVFNCLFVVENVIPYYEDLIKPTIKINRHYFWSNFNINKNNFKDETVINSVKGSCGLYDFDISKSNIKDKRQVLRNMVNPEVGKYILDCALGSPKMEQGGLF